MIAAGALHKNNRNMACSALPRGVGREKIEKLFILVRCAIARLVWRMQLCVT